MLVVISPAKTLDYDTPAKTAKFTCPDYVDDSAELIDILSNFTPLKLEKLMKISPALAELNMERYLNWVPQFTQSNAKQCIFAFKGDVYMGLGAQTLKAKDLDWAQNHLRILSGLYGLLRPLDLMQPYRLEMGTALKTEKGKNLYEFWGSTISDGLNQQLKKVRSDVLVNLASNEYFKSVQTKHLDASVVTPGFKDWKNGQYKMISFFAKKARGTMARWIIQNRISDAKDLVNFNEDGYSYDEQGSTEDAPLFLRKSQR